MRVSYTPSYDLNGNLTGLDLPNGIEKSYAFNSRNQLTGLSIENGGSLLRNYAYTLNSRGDWLRIDEASGRVREYAYDDLYRLTSETFSGGGAAAGTVGYDLDGIGNRLARTSSFAPLDPQTLAYDGNNRIQGPTYDANGNTLNSSLSLHKYLYAKGNPVSYEDPSGYFSIAGFNVSFSITINLRNVQALHIKKATASIAKEFLKIAIASAKRYLDFRGYATYNLSPISNASIYFPQFQAFTLSPGGSLMLDLLYAESLSFLAGAAAAGFANMVAAQFKVVKIKTKVSFGKFTMTLRKIIKYINKIGSAIGNAVNEYAQRYAIIRLATQAKSVYDLLQVFKGKIEKAAEYSALPVMAFDY